jgi:iron complex outermembrane receptor protein
MNDRAYGSKALRLALMSGAALALTATIAQAQTNQHTYNIPAESVSDALNDFGHQANLSVLFPYDAVSGKQTAAITGQLNDADVLQQLAAAGGLVVVSNDGKTVVLKHADTVKPQAAAAPSEEPTEVVVTGSRVIRNGNNSPTPVTVISTDEILKASPGTIAEALSSIPALMGSQGQTTNQGTSAGNLVGNVINLRGVGAARALILYDGHRVAPTTQTSLVNVDIIPQLLLKRVDLVTGGASAVYGSDAVSGVINFITDSKFNGLKFEARTGISQYGDGSRSEAGIAFGKKVFNDRGHIEFSYEYSNDPGISDKLSRPWFQKVWSEQGSVPGGGTVGTVGNPYMLTENTRLASTTFGGLITSGALSGLQFSQNGVLSPFVHGTPTGATGVQSGGDGAYYNATWLETLRVSNQVFSRFDYDLTDNIHAYAQIAGSQIHNLNNDRNSEVRAVQIGYNNAFLSSVQPQYQTQIASALTANPLSSFTFSKMFTDIPAYQADTHEQQFMFISGIDGTHDNYAWSVGYEHSDSIQDTRNNYNINRARLLASMNAVYDTNGNIVCNAALVNPTVYGDCKPLNLFGPSSANSDAINYIEQVTAYRAEYKMDDVSASLTGAPISTWAGPVNMAVSAEWRKLTYSLVSNALPTDVVDCTGIQFNCNASAPPTPYMSNIVANRTPVSQTVSEFAYEADIPLIKDKPGFQSVNLNVAGRYTNYDTSGSVWTWKLGGDWKVNDDVRFRGTRSRDIRAPNLNDLFAPPLYTPRSYVDPHTSTPGTVNSINLGNPDLTPELADTTTLGIVWRPSAAPRFSLAVDGYHIKINNAIVSVDAYNPAIGNLCETSGGTSPVCALFIRPLPFSDTSAANYPTALYAQSLNVASVETYGVDVEGNYATELFGRNLSLRGLVSYQPHLVYDQGPSGKLDAGGAADTVPGLPPIPSIKAQFVVNYNVTKTVSVLVQERWRGALKQNGASTLHFVDPKVPAAGYTDVTVTYDMRAGAGNAQLYLNIKNLFNKAPDPFASTGASAIPGVFGGFAQGDDIIGRYFTVGVRFRQ